MLTTFDMQVAYTVLTPAPAGGGGGGVASPAAGASGADVVAKDSKYYVTITVTMPYSKVGGKWQEMFCKMARDVLQPWILRTSR